MSLGATCLCEALFLRSFIFEALFLRILFFEPLFQRSSFLEPLFPRSFSLEPLFRRSSLSERHSKHTMNRTPGPWAIWVVSRRPVPCLCHITAFGKS